MLLHMKSFALHWRITAWWKELNKPHHLPKPVVWRVFTPCWTNLHQRWLHIHILECTAGMKFFSRKYHATNKKICQTVVTRLCIQLYHQWTTFRISKLQLGTKALVKVQISCILFVDWNLVTWKFILWAKNWKYSVACCQANKHNDWYLYCHIFFFVCFQAYPCSSAF